MREVKIMKQAKLFILLSIFGGLIYGFAFGAANVFPPSANVEAQTLTKCDFKTYIDDSDPNGTNIRAAAGKDASILKNIKNDDVIVTVSRFSGGWFEISRAEDVEGNTIFQNRGWIHSSLLGIRIAEADARLYAQPKKGSRVLMKLKSEESAVKLIACQNDWVKIQTGGKTGWLSPNGQCGNPVTTCP